jgi:DNA-binding NtrC family response regulator
MMGSSFPASPNQCEAHPTTRLLAIDDEPQILELVTAALENERVEVLTASSSERGLDLFFENRPRIVLTDLRMPGMSGMDILERIIAEDPGTEVILMTGHYSTDSAVEAIQKGACDYLTKPLAVEKLQAKVRQLLDQAGERRRALQLEHELIGAYQFEGIIGRSPAMLDLFSKIRRIAPHFRTVLVTGATGTGKELAARALHRSSPVAHKPFVVCNCSAIVDTLFESELFGYVRGAFTGANQDKAGLFEAANGGTAFLDEIGELPLAAQAKLLRVLQNQEVQRVGSPMPRKIDVRVIAATNRDLKSMVREKTFRDDLFYRLAMVEIRLPRVTDRKEDIPLLQRHFLDRFAQQYNKNVKGITRRAQRMLSGYSWPGNVREMENVIGSACMVAEGAAIDIEDLPEELRVSTVEAHEDGHSEELVSLEELERRHVLRVLEQMNGNKNRTAEVLGISRTTLYSLLAKIEAAGKEALAAK